MLRNCLESNNIPIRKKWGQNFLIDKNIIKNIIKIINPSINDFIIEIGPGKGALTVPLSKKVKDIIAVEIDPLLINFLITKKISNLTLLNKDILEWNHNKINFKNKTVKIIGNLPYYITSPIIFKFLKNDYWTEMIIMVQKEVAKRIISKCNCKDYSRISVVCQSFFDIDYELEVSHNSFHPRPKVNSALLKFKRKKNNFNIDEYTLFIKRCFAKKRKTMKNNLKDYLDVSIIEDYINKRAQQISVEEFMNLFKKIYI